MTFKISKKTLKTDLQFYDSSGVPFTLASPTLILKKIENSLAYCSLEFFTNLKTYQNIESKALFNLNPELRGQFIGQSFFTHPLIKIELHLNPFLVSQLEPYASHIQKVAEYLKSLALQEKKNILVLTQSWFATSVQQKQKQNIAGYHTFWKCVQLGEATKNFTVEDFLNGILEFLQETTDFNFAELEDDIAEGLEFYKKLSQLQTPNSNQELQTFLEDLRQKLIINNDLSEEEDTSLIDWSSLFKQLTVSERSSQESNVSEDWQSLSQEFTNKLLNPDENQLLQTVKQFFSQENWPIYQISDSPSFYVKVRGTNEEWYCLAQINEPYEQFIFYSYCPWLVPENKKLGVAEFLAKTNLELIVGNFELNYESGEIRYKTSIDVEGSRLVPSMVKQLISINIGMMDAYLPVIRQAIQTELTPLQRIQFIKNQS
ncbi:YbjN domain-containing protein [Spirulina sp. CS-785/01]|uniref:YbjN domain-containing protein n=1 Tax=Spirulina sp. CS-785/01 TaxID=3021716 RepID=UPI00232C2A26|nr:YbjN domain-containing protein [Spirulina sp. CS-785/01]MDB9313580.1 YbjN domain-containing protein [Spirulina sp. CS-785/01]